MARFVDQRRNRAGLSLDHRGCARDGDGFFRSGDDKVEIDFCCAAHINLQARSGLRRHAGRFGAARVIPGGKKLKIEPAFTVGGSGVTQACGGVDEYDVGPG